MPAPGGFPQMTGLGQPVQGAHPTIGMLGADQGQQPGQGHGFGQPVFFGGPQQQPGGQQLPQGGGFTPLPFPQGMDPAQQQGQQQGGYPQQQGFQAPQQFQQPFQQPGQVPNQQGPRQVVLDDNTILTGPGVPPELQGRPFGQVKHLYAGLTNFYLQNQGRPQGQPAQQPPQQQPQQQNGQQQTPVGPPRMGFQQQEQARPAAQFLADPVGQIREVLRQEVQPMLAPVIQQNLANQIQQAEIAAQQMIPDFQQLAPFIKQKVAVLDAASQASPDAWLMAADLARGELLRVGQYRPVQNPNGAPNRVNGGYPQQGQQNGAQQGFQQGIAGAAGPPGWVPAGQYPYMPFFSENPSGGFSGDLGSGVLTPLQRTAARGFGMSDEEYLAWLGGVQRS